jgi:hypothetical protein
MNVLLAEMVVTLDACAKLKARGVDVLAALAEMQSRDPGLRLNLSVTRDESNGESPESVTLELGTSVPVSLDGDNPRESVLTALASAIAHLTGVGLDIWRKTEPYLIDDSDGERFV